MKRRFNCDCQIKICLTSQYVSSPPHLTFPPEPQEGDKATSARGKAKDLAATPPAGLSGKVREAGKSSLADDDDFQQQPASQPTRPSRARPEVQRYKASSQGGGW